MLKVRVGAVTMPRQAHLLCARETYGRKNEVELGTACRTVLGFYFLFDIDSMSERAQ